MALSHQSVLIKPAVNKDNKYSEKNEGDGDQEDSHNVTDGIRKILGQPSLHEPGLHALHERLNPPGHTRENYRQGNADHRRRL